MRVGEVQTLALIELDRSQQKLMIRSRRWKGEQGASGVRDRPPRPFVEGLEHLHEFGEHEIRKDELVVASEERSRPPSVPGRIARQMADEDVRVAERPHRRASARLPQVSALTRAHEVTLLPGGTGTLPARSRKSGTLARTARSLCTRNQTRSPALSCSFSRTDLGRVTWPFDVTVAGTSIVSSLLPSRVRIRPGIVVPSPVPSTVQSWNRESLLDSPSIDSRQRSGRSSVGRRATAWSVSAACGSAVGHTG